MGLAASSTAHLQSINSETPKSCFQPSCKLLSLGEWCLAKVCPAENAGDNVQGNILAIAGNTEGVKSVPTKCGDEMKSSELDAISDEQIPETPNPEKSLRRVKTTGPKQKEKNKVATSIRKPVTADDKMNSSELDTVPAKQILETSNLEKDLRRVITRGTKQKAINKATPPRSKPVTVGDKTCSAVSCGAGLSEDAEEPYMNVRRKLAYETPKRKMEIVPFDSMQSSSFKRSKSGRLMMPKLEFWRNQSPVYNEETPKRKMEIVPFDSPQSSNFKRSRSGRLLMPKLEFWRNQIPIYNEDRTVIEIVEDMQLQRPKKGRRSTAQKKRESDSVKLKNYL